MSESTGPVNVTSSVAEFEFRSLLGTEELGQPFRYEVEVLNRSSTLSADKMLGSTMTIAHPAGRRAALFQSLRH